MISNGATNAEWAYKLYFNDSSFCEGFTNIISPCFYAIQETLVNKA